ncbi:MAG TPA: hypothetical protein VIS06_02685 [Mycobacteriales bacterium]
MPTDGGEALVEKLADAVEGFTVPVRMGDGIDDHALGKLREVIVAVASTYRAENVIPKRVAAIFVELYPAIEGSVALYDDDAAERVLSEANELLDLILSSLATD